MKYAVAIINFFDNENKIHVVEADNEIDAMKKAILKINPESELIIEDYDDLHTIEDIKNYMFDVDQSISSPLQIN